MALDKCRGAHANIAKLQLKCQETQMSTPKTPAHRYLLEKIKRYNNNDVDQLSSGLTDADIKARVPYRQNRAVLFHSSFFHQTDAPKFKAGYTNRRINYTLLFGFRQSEICSA